MNTAAAAFERAHASASRDWGTIAAWIVIAAAVLYVAPHLLAFWSRGFVVVGS